MIILDNSVLSAFKRLKLFSKLNLLITTAIISKEVFNEYSKQWQKKIPKWINVIKPKEESPFYSVPVSLSKADISLIRLALALKLPIASDDRPLRLYAKELGITTIGSLALLKKLYQSRIIKTRKEYLTYLETLQEDIYLSEELRKWALED